VPACPKCGKSKAVSGPCYACSTGKPIRLDAVPRALVTTLREPVAADVVTAAPAETETISVPSHDDMVRMRNAMDRALAPVTNRMERPHSDVEAEPPSSARVARVYAVTIAPMMLEADSKLSRRPDSVTLYLSHDDARSLLQQLTAVLDRP